MNQYLETFDKCVQIGAVSFYEPVIFGEVEEMFRLCDKKAVSPRNALYFLFKGDTLVYVGQTGCLKSRISDHKGGKCDSVMAVLLRVHWEELERIEKLCIQHLDPPLNLAHTSRDRRLNKSLQHKSITYKRTS